MLFHKKHLPASCGQVILTITKFCLPKGNPPDAGSKPRQEDFPYFSSFSAAWI